MEGYRGLGPVRSCCIGGIIALVCSLPSMAQLYCSPEWTPEYKCMEHCGPCAGSGGGGGGGPIDPTFGILTEIIRLHEHAVQVKNATAAAKAATASQAHDLNDQGLEAWKSGNFDSAVSLFTKALQLAPNNPVIANNLRQASERSQGDKTRDLEIHQGLDRLTTAVNNLQAVASVPGLDFDGAGTGNISTHDEMTFVPAGSPTPGVSNDPMVVDARFDAISLQGVADYRDLLGVNDPEVGERMRKGLQAVASGDWPVALAWWQDALNRDPNNLAIQRSVDLAKSTLDYRSRIAKLPVTPYAPALDAWSKGAKGDAMGLMQKTAAQNPASAEAAKPLVKQMLDFTALDEALERKLNDPVPPPPAKTAVTSPTMADVKAFVEKMNHDPVLYAKVLREQSDSMESYGIAHIAYGLTMPRTGANEAPETTLGFKEIDTAYKMKIIAAKAAICNCMPDEKADLESSEQTPVAGPHN